MPDDEFMTKREQAELFKEWREDYALRKEEDANRRLAPPASDSAREAPTAGPPHPWPSEIAGANRQAKPDRPQPKEMGNGRDTGHSM